MCQRLDAGRITIELMQTFRDGVSNPENAGTIATLRLPGSGYCPGFPEGGAALRLAVRPSSLSGSVKTLYYGDRRS